jgi:hypothetical protein
MTVRPIIFSAPMVRALIEGRKTQTRRLAKGSWLNVVPGDLLYVRETIQRFNREPPTAQYAATITAVMAPPEHVHALDGRAGWQWKKAKLPAIHMPRWASRLTLGVNSARRERLQDMWASDAIAEGITGEGRNWTAGAGCDGTDPIQAFRALWWRLHGIESWNENPWVVALTFTVHQKNVDEFLQQKASAA